MLRLAPLLLVLADLGACYHPPQSTTVPPTTTPNSIPYTTALPQTPAVNVNNYASSGFVNSPSSTTPSSNLNIRPQSPVANIAKSPFKSKGAGNNRHGSRIYAANPQIQPFIGSRNALINNNLNTAQLQQQQQQQQQQLLLQQQQLQQQQQQQLIANSQFQAPAGSFQLQALAGNAQVQGLGGAFQNQGLTGSFPLQNPPLQNPQLQNPQLQNPQLQNPQLQTPQIQNPLQNPQLQAFGGNSQVQSVGSTPNFPSSTENILLATLIGTYPSQPFPIIPPQNTNNAQPQVGVNPQVQGLAGNPQLQALGANFQNPALVGNPQLQALGGNSQLQGLSGNPQLQALGGNSQLQALAGNPQLQALAGNPQLQALAGNPQLQQQAFQQLQQQAFQQSGLSTPNNFANNVLANPQLQSSLALNNPNGFNINNFNPQLQAPVVNAYLNPLSTQIAPSNFANRGLDVAFQWRFLDWVHPTVQLAGKNFTVGNPLSQDVDIDSRGRVFVTSPQWLEGTPITLSVITDLKGEGGPLLTPYPDWTWHKQDCGSLVSVYRVAIDECNRIWMVDTGAASGRQVCPVKLLAFDLKTDQLILRYQIPEDQTAGRTAQYVNPVVEVGDSCKDTFVYVADVIGHGLLIYSMRENRSWRLSNTRTNAFGHDPEATSLTIAGETIQLNDGTLGVALTPRGLFTKRYLYFNSLASFYQKFADTDSLKRSFVYEPIMYQSVAKRVSQAGVHAISKTGAMFFQLAQFTALACWNVERPFTPENVVVLAQDSETLQYISGIKVVTNSFGEEELWFNTNRLQKTINNSRRINEVNFRLMRGKVEDLIRGTRCAPSGLRPTEPSLQGWRRI